MKRRMNFIGTVAASFNNNILHTLLYIYSNNYQIHNN